MSAKKTTLPIRQLTSTVDGLCESIDFVAKYEETSTTALSANPTVAVPLLTINGWILMQRKVTGGSVTFNQNWAAYRNGFGSATGEDNYWLGLDKVYRLVQLGSARLRIEVEKMFLITVGSLANDQCECCLLDRAAAQTRLEVRRQTYWYIAAPLRTTMHTWRVCRPTVARVMHHHHHHIFVYFGSCHTQLSHIHSRPDHPWGWWGWSPIGARTARYNENLQSRTTLGPEIVLAPC